MTASPSSTAAARPARPAAPRLLASIVIPTYRRPQMVRRAIESALAQDLEKDAYEVIVVDTSPDEETAAVVEALRESAPCALRLVRKAPEGPGRSRQAGAAVAQGEIVAFMDSDCRAHPGWLRTGVAAFEEGVGIVAGRIAPEPEVPTGVLRHWVEVDAPTVYYPGANVLFRRSCLDAVEDLPRDVTPKADRPTGGEDTLLAWRVKRAGWRSTFAAGAIVYHEVKPISPWFWLVTRHRPLLIIPGLVREIPELRDEFFLRCFYDRAQAAVVIGLIGTGLVALTPLSLLAWLPYVAVRSLQRTRALSGWKRLLRPLFYAPIDLVSFGFLVAGSVRARRVVV